jgi:hypothetical protein
MLEYKKRIIYWIVGIIILLALGAGVFVFVKKLDLRDQEDREHAWERSILICESDWHYGLRTLGSYSQKQGNCICANGTKYVAHRDDILWRCI